MIDYHGVVLIQNAKDFMLAELVSSSGLLLSENVQYLHVQCRLHWCLKRCADPER